MSFRSALGGEESLTSQPGVREIPPCSASWRISRDDKETREASFPGHIGSPESCFTGRRPATYFCHSRLDRESYKRILAFARMTIGEVEAKRRVRTAAVPQSGTMASRGRLELRGGDLRGSPLPGSSLRTTPASPPQARDGIILHKFV